jgi:hypothetical protein
MPRRFLVALLALAIAVVLSLLAAGLLQWFFGSPPEVAFLVEGPRLMFTFMDVGLIIWAALLAIGAFRGRGLGYGTLGGILAALIAVIVNLVVVVIIAIVQGGADIFAIALGVEAGIIFLVAALIAVLVVRPLAARRHATA